MNNSSTPRISNRSRVSQILFRIGIVALLFVTAVAANCVYSFSEYSTGKRNASFIDGEIVGAEPVLLSAAGWPWCFYQRFQCEQSPSWYAWDSWRLVGNIVFWMLIGSFAWWYAGTRGGYNRKESEQDSIVQPESVPRGRSRRRQWSIADLLLMVALVASALGYLSRYKARYAESQELIKTIRREGGVVSEGYSMPSFASLLSTVYMLDYVLPRERIVQVSMQNPSSELLRRVVSQPHLQSLRLSGESFSVSDLQPLTRNPNLRDLRLSGRKLDQPTIELVARIKSLQSLNLMRTNITAAGMAALGEMPRLRYVHLGHTDVDLRETTIEPWMRSVRYLRIPRPKRGETTEFNLDGWPELEDLQCMEFDELLNESPVKLSISNSPKLKTITLDSLQRFDLQLINLPNLKKLTVRNESIKERSLMKDVVPSDVWIQKAILKNLPSLEQVKFFVRSFDRIQIHDCPKLDCEPVWKCMANKPISNADTVEWIAGIGNSVGITTLNLVGLPIRGLDISPAAACKTIRKLECPLDLVSHLHPLASLHSIAELRIVRMNSLTRSIDLSNPNRTRPSNTAGDSPIQNDVRVDLSNMLRIWPSLERIDGDFPMPNEIRLESAKHLKSIKSGDYRTAEFVNLADLPKLEDQVHLSISLKSIHATGTPNIRGLLSFSAWPFDASIQGLRELEVFSAGGARFQDKDFDEIANSSSLRSLTLGYSGVSSERLQGVGRFSKMELLALSGSAVMDSTVREWSSMKNLRTLLLDRTQISAASFPWICSLRSLERLSINADCWTPSSLSQLSSLRSLQSVFLYGNRVCDEALSDLANCKRLSVLKFENATLTKQQMKLLAKSLPKSLSILDFCNCNIDPSDFSEFINAISLSIRLGVKGLELSEEILDQLLNPPPVVIKTATGLVNVQGIRMSRAVSEIDGQFFLARDNYAITNSLPQQTGASQRMSPTNFSYVQNVSSEFESKGIKLVNPSLFAPQKTVVK